MKTRALFGQVQDLLSVDQAADSTGFPEKLFRVYFKKNILKTNRRNIDEGTYFGLARIYVKESSELVRKITGWVQGIVVHLK